MQKSQTNLIISLCDLLGSINDNERYVFRDFLLETSQEAEAQMKTYYNMDGFLLTLLEITQLPVVNHGSR